MKNLNRSSAFSINYDIYILYLLLLYHLTSFIVPTIRNELHINNSGKFAINRRKWTAYIILLVCVYQINTTILNSFTPLYTAHARDSALIISKKEREKSFECMWKRQHFVHDVIQITFQTNNFVANNCWVARFCAAGKV